MRPFLFIAYFGLASGATASLLPPPGADSVVIDTTSVRYEFRTRGNNFPNTGGSGFEPNSWRRPQASQSLTYERYLDVLPDGSVITGATLDFTGLFNNFALSFSLVGGVFFYQPIFSVELVEIVVDVDSLDAEATLHVGCCAAYDLWPVFGTALAAGEPISFTWTAVECFSADISGYDAGIKNGSEEFLVEADPSLGALEMRNALRLYYSTDNEPVPEAPALWIAGGALTALAAGIFRRAPRRSNELQTIERITSP